MRIINGKESKKPYVLLNPEESKIVATCLVYCLHRLHKHEKSGIANAVSKVAVESLVREFNKVDN